MPPLVTSVVTDQGRVVLTGEQEAAVAHLLRHLSHKPAQSLGGFAGTGKSVVVKALQGRLPRFAAVAYTGKAACVLRRRGVEAATIHSTIYRAHERVWWDEQGRRHVGVIFERRPARDVPGTGFLVDEASMIGQTLYRDLLSYGRPVVFVGDHGQLPPVGDEAIDLMARPDVVLEQVHRNAGAVAHFAQWLRQGSDPAGWPGHGGGGAGEVAVVTDPGAWLAGCQEEPQFLCATNGKRVFWNRFFRDVLRLPADRPVPGDRVMCLQNDHQLGVYNGQQGVVQEVLPGHRLVFRAGDVDTLVPYLPEAFNWEVRPERDRGGRLPFDYAYCVTCHKAQGDEWGEVLVLEQPRWPDPRWRYTAASRARRRLGWFVPRCEEAG
jgi:exodeoxyribonuclease-5